VTKPGRGVDPDPDPIDPPPDLPPPPQTIDLATFKGELPPSYNVTKPFLPEPEPVDRDVERFGKAPKEGRRPLPPPEERKPGEKLD
jgi:hypothetical protein